MDWTSLGIQTNFTALDWCIVAGYIGAVLAGGVYIRRYVKNAADFMIAGRGLGTFVAAATMIATELGLVTVMYAAQKGFTGGFAAFHIALAATIMTLMVGLTGFIVVPLRRLRVTTIPEYYEKRFGRGVRILGGLILALSGILNMGLFLNSASLFVMGITGLTGVFHLKLIMTALLAMVLIYTSLGGMVSVVVLDYVQFLVLSFAFVAMSVLSIQHLGWTNIVDTVVQLKGEAGFNPFHSEGFGVSYVVWMFFLGLVSCAVWQTAVIRACAADSVKTVKKIYLWSAVGFLIRFLLPYFFGISALVYMSQHEGLRKVFLPEGGPVDPGVSLLAMPVFFSQILPVGVIGIVTAGMLAAFMSTHDSYLLCWSTVLVQDVVSPCFKGGLSPRTRLWLTRLLIPLIGLYTLVWGLWYPMSEDLWDYMAISGAIYFTGAFALLAFGLYWKRASRIGAYLALTAGFGAILGLTPVQRLVGMKVSSELVGLTVVATAMALMVLGSVLFPDRKPLTVQEGKGVEGHAVLD